MTSTYYAILSLINHNLAPVSKNWALTPSKSFISSGTSLQVVIMIGAGLPLIVQPLRMLLSVEIFGILRRSINC